MRWTCGCGKEYEIFVHYDPKYLHNVRVELVPVEDLPPVIQASGGKD